MGTLRYLSEVLISIYTYIRINLTISGLSVVNQVGTLLKFLFLLLLALNKPGSLRLRPFTARLLLALITSGSLWLRLFPARLLPALIKPGSLWLLPALIKPGSLCLRLFPARLLPALITSGSLRLRLLQRGFSQLFSTPAHTARYYIYLNIYTEPGEASSDTSKVLYKEKDIYNLLRKKKT
jgi:hypothetical protein